MKFNIDRSSLLNAVNTVLKGMSSRSTLPILSGILLDAQGDGKLVLQTTDLEISIRHSIDADIVGTGKVVVPGKLFADIVKQLPDAAVTVDSDGGQTQVSCMSSKFTLSSLNAADFPYFPEVAADTTVTLAAALLDDAVKKVGCAVSRDESRAILTGILFSVEGGSIRLAATDSYRLAVVDLPGDAGAGIEEFQAVIPGKTLGDVARLAASFDAIEIGFAENQVVFRFGETVFVSRKIEGTYPNYKQLIPSTHETAITVNAKDLVTSIKRAALLAQTHTPIRFDFSAQDQDVSISAKTQDVGGAQETIDCSIEGEDIQIAFNHQYILDGLNAIEGDALIELQSSLKPGIIKGSGSQGFLYLAMPVRLS